MAQSGSSTPADLPPPLVVVGAGAAGAGLARALSQVGWPVDALVCRDAARAREQAARVGAGRALTFAALLAERPRAGGPLLVLLAVPDRAIAEVAGQLAARHWPAGSVALHVSGSVAVDALAPLRGAGLAIGACHPLKSFVDVVRDGAGLAGTVFAVEGEPAALALAERLARAVGGEPFRLQPGTRGAWHAAASHAANHLVALLDQALDLGERAGLSRDAARSALVRLMAGTLEHLTHAPPGRALTGPLVRGDVEVIAAHLAALEGLGPDLDSAYRALARRALILASRERGLDDATRARLAALLQDPPVP